MRRTTRFPDSPSRFLALALAVATLVAPPSNAGAQTRTRTVYSALFSGGEIDLAASSSGNLSVTADGSYRTVVVVLSPRDAEAWIDTTIRLVQSSAKPAPGETLTLDSPILKDGLGSTMQVHIASGADGVDSKIVFTSPAASAVFPSFESVEGVAEFLRAMRRAAALTRVMTPAANATPADSAAANRPFDACLINRASAVVSLAGDTTAASAAPGYVASMLEQIRGRFTPIDVSNRIEVVVKLQPDGSVKKASPKGGGLDQLTIDKAVKSIKGPDGNPANYGPLPAAFGGKETELRFAFGCERPKP